MKKFLLMSLLFAIIFNSCKKNNNTKKFQYPKAETILMHTIKDSTNQYYIYFPKNYVNDGSCPIFIGFDAHKNGKKFVDKLKLAAEKLHIVIVGSMNFENNSPQASYIANTLLQDIQKRFMINHKAIFVGGFSGGGRFAQILALQNLAIDGILSFSAGLSFNQQPNRILPMSITFGTYDFNYSEASYSIKLANKLNIPLAMFIFDGKHQYPDDTTATKAAMFLYAYAMKKNWIKKDKQKIKTIEAFLKQIYDEKKGIDKYFAAIDAINILNNLGKTDEYQNFIQKYANSKDYKNYIQKINKINQIENNLMHQYYKLFDTKSTKWWQNEILHLNQKINSTTDKDYLSMYKRIKAFLGILSYQKAKQQTYDNELKKLKKTLYIYQLLEPQNPDLKFFKAVYYKQQNKIDSAKIQLQKAIKLGFDTTSVMFTQLW